MNIRCQPGSFQWPRLHWGQKSENFLGMVTSHPSPMGTPFYHVTTIALILTQPFLPPFFFLWIGWNLVGFSLWCVLNSWSPAIGLSVKYHLLRRSDFVAGFQRHIVFFSDASVNILAKKSFVKLNFVYFFFEVAFSPGWKNTDASAFFASFAWVVGILGGTSDYDLSPQGNSSSCYCWDFSHRPSST